MVYIVCTEIIWVKKKKKKKKKKEEKKIVAILWLPSI